LTGGGGGTAAIGSGEGGGITFSTGAIFAALPTVCALSCAS